jgi:phage terminase small subunit
MKPRHLRFCEEYLNNGYNIRAATQAAGYKCKNQHRGYDLIRMPHIQEYLTRRINQQCAVEQITYDWKVKKLKNVIDKCMPQEIPHAPLPLNATQPQTAVSAISELNKMQGHYAPVKQISVNFNNDADLKATQELTNLLIAKHESDY